MLAAALVWLGWDVIQQACFNQYPRIALCTHDKLALLASAILHILLKVCQVDEIASLVPRACIMLVAGQSVVDNVAYAAELFSQHHQLSAGQLDSRLPQPSRGSIHRAALIYLLTMPAISSWRTTRRVLQPVLFDFVW